MKKISYTKLALSLLLASSVLVGCGKGTDPQKEQTSLTSPATVAQSPQLQAIDTAFKELQAEQQKFLDALNKAITDKTILPKIKSDAVSQKIGDLKKTINTFRDNQLSNIKGERQATVQQALENIDTTLDEISQQVIDPFKQGLTKGTIENVQKNLGFFETQNIDPQYYGNLGKTTVEEITRFLQDKQKSLEDNIKNLKSPAQASPKSTIDSEIQKLSDRIAQLEKEKTSSNTTFLVAILALLAGGFFLLRSRKKLRQSFSIRNLSSVLKFWNRGTNPAGKLTEENIDNSSTQVDTQNLSTNETQLYYEIYDRVYNDIYKKLSEEIKYIERKITQENRKINDRIADLELKIHNWKTKDTKVREQKEPTGITIWNPSEPPASQTYQSTSPSVSSSSHSLGGDNYDQDARSSSLIEVSPTEESLANREMGGTDPIVLKNKRRGYYEVYLDGNYHCLVPSQNFRINQNNYKSVEDLFEFQNYDPNYSDSYTVIRPAVVYPLAGGQTWQLQQRGVLRF
jgi:LPXTG-motif cell wall-anchored protein